MKTWAGSPPEISSCPHVNGWLSIRNLASFEYDKGKRQNLLLLPEHIDIIDTYQHRKEEARYARRVGMAEIEKNDFNLNISRYVSTTEAEDEIDLNAVHQELAAVDQKIKAATASHNAFLKELGLPLLP